MKKFYRMLLLFILILISSLSRPLSAEQKMTIAVLDLQGKGVPGTVAKAATDFLRSEFVNVANFTVVERSAMNAIMEEQGLQMSGCTDQSCAVEIGKLLSARKIITGELNRLDNAVLLTIRIIDVEKGVAEYSAREKAQSIDDIDRAAVRIARNLTQRIVSGEKEFFTPQTPLGYYTRSIVPGWGQLYSGHYKKGTLFGGMFILSGFLAYYRYGVYTDSRDAYNGAAPGAGNFTSLRDEYQSSADMYNYSLVLVGVMYMAHWVDVVFFSKPDFGTRSEKKSAAIDNASFHFAAIPRKIENRKEIWLDMSVIWRF